MKYKDLKKKLKTIDKKDYGQLYDFMEWLKNGYAKSSAKGIGHKYANPDLIPLEKEAMANAFSGEAKK